MTWLTSIVCGMFLFSFCFASPSSDFQYMKFVRDWSAHCIEKALPSYHWQELSPATRKCDTERCVYLIYDYIAKLLPEHFEDFDVCFEKNTKMPK